MAFVSPLQGHIDVALSNFAVKFRNPAYVSDQVKLPAATGDRAKGITALAADAAGKAIPIIIGGPAVGTAAAAITAGSFVKVAAASGKLQAVGGEAASTVVEVVGIALTSASADGDRFDLLVAPSRYIA